MNNTTDNPEGSVHRKETNMQSVFHAYDEMKFPLSSIQGLLLLISYLPKTHEMQHYLRMIEACANDMDALMSKMARFRVPAITPGSEVKIDAGKLISEVLGRFTESVTEHNLQVIIETDQNQLWVGDYASVAEIVRQLVSNSIAFRNPDPGNRKIQIRVGVTSHFTRLEISDNGIGIASQHHVRIFEPFFKASEQSKGLGLGLYLVTTMVKNIGASLDFHSKENEGSTFVVTIPNNLYE